MSNDSENIKRQEMGPRRYRDMIERTNREYDTYKKGKRNPKTGEYYYDISFNKPRKYNFGQSLGFIDCPFCDNYFEVRTSTRGIICSKCNKFISLDYDKNTKELIITNG